MAGSGRRTPARSPTPGRSTRLARCIATVLLCAVLVAPAGAAALATPRQAPELNAPELFTGAAVSLQQYRGRVVLIDFWASWCGSCWRALPLLAELQSRYRDRGLVVLAVTVDEDPAVAREFATRKQLSFTILDDHTGSIADRYDVHAMPHSFLVDADGRIVAEFEGFRDDSAPELRHAVAAAMEAAAATAPPRP